MSKGGRFLFSCSIFLIWVPSVLSPPPFSPLNFFWALLSSKLIGGVPFSNCCVSNQLLLFTQFNLSVLLMFASVCEVRLTPFFFLKKFPFIVVNGAFVIVLELSVCLWNWHTHTHTLFPGFSSTSIMWGPAFLMWTGNFCMKIKFLNLWASKKKIGLF